MEWKDHKYVQFASPFFDVFFFINERLRTHTHTHVVIALVVLASIEVLFIRIRGFTCS